MRKLALVLAMAVAAALAGCGSSSGGGGGTQHVDLMLDFFPNADHAGIYAAQAGNRFGQQHLNVQVRAPSDPAAPLKFVAAGKADLAISYEPEVLRARDKGLKVVAVGALIRTPLTSIVSLPKAGIRTPKDLAGKTVGTAGIDYQGAYLQQIQPAAKERNVGFDLVPALVSGKVDAVLGAYWNYEAIQLRQKGKNPHVIRIEQAGVPTYDELVIVASEKTVKDRPQVVRRFLTGLAKGSIDLAVSEQKGINALMRANPDLDRKLQTASVTATLPFMLPEQGRPYGYMDPGDWARFTAFMHRNGLLKATTPKGAFTNSLLPQLGAVGR